MLYSGVAAIGALLIATQMRNVWRGHRWTKALPYGYLPSLVGVLIFLIGGGFDFLWHSAFGFEVGVEPLLSPPHLLLASTGILICTGPLRAAWVRRSGEGWRALFPALMSLLLLSLTLTFFTQFSNLFTVGRALLDRPEAGRYFWDVTGISYVIVPTAIQMLILFIGLRRWNLPFGAVTFLLTANALLMFYLRLEFQQPYWPILLGAPAAGLVADLYRRWQQPLFERVLALRVFAFLVPFVQFGLALGALQALYGLDWRIHMWLGAALLAGAVGLGLSYLVVPPAIQREDT
jgi:hypothetical protein